MCCRTSPLCLLFFFFNDPATTEIYPLSLHDALPISPGMVGREINRSPVKSGRQAVPHAAFTLSSGDELPRACLADLFPHRADRKSTRLNSSHSQISYAVFCLKKKRDTPQQVAHEDLH